MKKSNRIIVLLDDEEKEVLGALSEKMSRSYGETFRVALKELVKKVHPMPRHKAIVYERE